MDLVSESRCFGGVQAVYKHSSQVCDTTMTFGLFLPEEARDGPVPALWFLGGLTCTHENAMIKAGAQAWAAEAGVALVFPDTSPRGAGVADDDAYDLGQGAGFYLDATQAPWAPHFQMERYIMDELPSALVAHGALDPARQSITGHSMGGHGALTLAMRHPGRFRSVSAFAPICNPTASDWGRKQFAAYLGPESPSWAEHDACALIRAHGLDAPLLVDTGTDDQFFDLLGTAAFAQAVTERRSASQLRLQQGYDHGYFFVASFMEEHMAFHAEALWA